MNVLIVADKAYSNSYKNIVKTAPNTSVLGTVTSINASFISALKDKWHPHMLIFDTSVPTDKVNIFDTLTDIHNIYPYIKVIVLADEDDIIDYPAYAVIKGQISNLEIKELIKEAQGDDNYLLANSNVTKEFNNKDSDNHTEKTKLKDYSNGLNLDNLSEFKFAPERELNKEQKKKRKQIRIKKRTIFLIALIPVVVTVITLLTLLLFNRPNDNNNNIIVATADELSSTQVLTTSTEPTEKENSIIVSFTDAPTIAVTEPKETSKKDDKKSKNEKKNDKKESSSKTDAEVSKNETNKKPTKPVSSTNKNNSSSKAESSKVNKPSSSSSKNETSKKPTSATINVTSISLSKSSMRIIEGDRNTFKVTLKPDKATNKNYTISCSNTNATATKSGNTVTVYANNEGTCKITIKSGNVKATCTVTINAKPTIPPTTEDPVKLSTESHGIVIGQTITITLNNCSSCSWKIETPSIVQICGGGSNSISIKGVNKGSTLITAIDKKTGKRYECTVTVN